MAYLRAVHKKDSATRCAHPNVQIVNWRFEVVCQQDPPRLPSTSEALAGIGRTRTRIRITFDVHFPGSQREITGAGYGTNSVAPSHARRHRPLDWAQMPHRKHLSDALPAPWRFPILIESLLAEFLGMPPRQQGYGVGPSGV